MTAVIVLRVEGRYFEQLNSAATSWTVLPTARFYRRMGLVLDLFHGKKLAVAGCGFLGFFLSLCRYYWASFRSGGFYVMCYIKSRHILRHVIHTVNSQFKAA